MTFKPNPAYLAKLLNSTGVLLDMMEAARPGLAAAKASAPKDTGRLANSLEVWAEITDRVVARYGSRSVEYAAAVEAATGFLAKSQDAIGR